MEEEQKPKLISSSTSPVIEKYLIAGKGLYIYYVISRRKGGGSCRQNMTIHDIYLGGSFNKKYSLNQFEQKLSKITLHGN